MDGTGYGTDGTIWGGEFLICEKGDFQRAAYLKPVPLLMGNDSIKDCQKTAAAYLHASGLHDFVADSRYNVIRRALEHGVNTIQSSSMGRLFDAVSSILGLCDWNRYEAEGAILLENAANRALLKRSGHKCCDLYFGIIEKDEGLIMDSEPLIKSLSGSLIKGIRSEKIVDELALAFHQALASGIADTLIRLRARTNMNDVVLSGGVFQNKILTETTIRLLKENSFVLHMPSQVPPNDGGISLGQAFVAINKLKG
jgi:hydrogenase maturation protein HypF